MNQQKSQKSRDPRDTSRADDTTPRAAPDGGQADPAMQGEGNRTAARRYNEETTDFARSGRVDDAARSARPADAGEAREMERAEAEGKAHAREEDALLHQRAQPGRSGQVNGTGARGNAGGGQPSGGRPTRH